jgi:hypothetical protein
VRDEHKSPFDSILFFLRGGYFAFAYLNTTDELLERAVIFAGLSHGKQPEQQFEQWINARIQKASGGRICLLVIDEVKSGSGMARVLGVFKRCLLDVKGGNGVECDLTFYAIRPQPEMSLNLRKVVAKWAKRHERHGSNFTVTIEHFAGSLLGYDDDVMCGIQRTSHSSSPSESYDMVRLSQGTLEFVCETSGAVVTAAFLVRSTLVEFLAACARSLTTLKTGTIVRTFIVGTEQNGCDRCKALLHRVRGRFETEVSTLISSKR